MFCLRWSRARSVGELPAHLCGKTARIYNETMKTIISLRNPALQRYRDLRDSKVRREAGLLLDSKVDHPTTIHLVT